MTIGQVAFEAYALSASSGQSWSDIGADEQGAWEAAANAVVGSQQCGSEQKAA